MAANKGYTLHLWNGKYGNNAKFVVENNTDNKFCEYSPTRPSDVVWVDTDLTSAPDYKDWQSFEKEQVDDLSNIIM